MDQEYLVDGDWPKLCQCGAQFMEPQWEGLVLDSWRHQKGRGPKGMTIENRLCPCGRSLAHVEFDVYEESFDINEREAPALPPRAPPIPGAPPSLGI